MKINVALSGSGQIYPAFIGALRCLQDNDFQIVEMSATSGGAVIAASYASGYNPSNTMVELTKKTLPLRNKLFDPSIFSLLWRWGFIKGKRIEELFQKTFCKTLGEAKIPIHIVTSNITKNTKQVFSSTHTPHIPTATAIRTSISIPFIFAPVKINGDLLVDGGIVKNFPVDVFENKLPTIGIRIIPTHTQKKIKTILDFVTAIIDTVIRANEEESIEDKKCSLGVIPIKTKYDAMNFKISEPDVDVMIQEGYQATSDWINSRRAHHTKRS